MHRQTYSYRRWVHFIYISLPITAMNLREHFALTQNEHAIIRIYRMMQDTKGLVINYFVVSYRILSSRIVTYVMLQIRADTETK